MRSARDRFGVSRPVRLSVVIGASLAIAGAIAGAYGGLARSDRRTDEALLAEAVANLERQADSLAARPGVSTSRIQASPLRSCCYAVVVTHS